MGWSRSVVPVVGLGREEVTKNILPNSLHFSFCTTGNNHGRPNIRSKSVDTKLRAEVWGLNSVEFRATPRTPSLFQPVIIPNERRQLWDINMSLVWKKHSGSMVKGGINSREIV